MLDFLRSHPGKRARPTRITATIPIQESARLVGGCIRSGWAKALVLGDLSLIRLAKVDERKSQVVEMRFVWRPQRGRNRRSSEGLSGNGGRDWRLAKAWLLREMSGKANEA